MAIRPTLATQWFLDPISGKPFTDPLMNHCGHSYDKVSLEQWKTKEKETQNICPLCRAPIQALIHNLLLQQAASIASSPDHKNFTEANQLDDESQEIIGRAIQAISQQRARDELNNTPIRLTPYLGGEGVLNRVAECSREVSQESKRCLIA